MKLVAYNEPILEEYRSRSFRTSRAKWKARIERRTVAAPWVRSGSEPWIRYLPAGARPKREQAWVPKAYVCVSPANYWPLIASLIDRVKGDWFAWKFYAAPRGNERPDKIVLHVRTRRTLIVLLRSVRRQMPTRGFHGLRHAVSTAHLGLERAGMRGLYVGIDPIFLGTSWRLYRCVCVAWAWRNHAYIAALPGGEGRWFRRMNISTEHEGPASLQPDVKDLAYVRRYWGLMTREALGAHRRRSRAVRKG